MSFTIIRPPVYVGYWEIGGSAGLRIAKESRPCWLHRTLCKLLLGIVWRDYPKQSQETGGLP